MRRPRFSQSVEIDHVRVDVVQERPLGAQAQRHRQAAAERLDQPAMRVRRARAARRMRHLPALAARPFQRRQRRRRLADSPDRDRAADFTALL